MTTHGSLVISWYAYTNICKVHAGCVDRKPQILFLPVVSYFLNFFLMVWLTWRSIWTEHRHPIRAGIPRKSRACPSGGSWTQQLLCSTLLWVCCAHGAPGLWETVFFEKLNPISAFLWMFNQLFWGSIWIFSVVDSDQPSEYSLQRKGCLIHVLGWEGIDLQVLCVLLGCQCLLSLTGSLLELLKQLTWCPDGTGEYRLSLSEMIT